MTDTFEFETVRVNAKGEIVERQRKSAEYIREDLGGGVFLDMVLIPGGTFMMGSPEDELGRSYREKWVQLEQFDCEKPQHEVSVSAFLMGKYPVTQAQWRAIVTQVPKIQRELDPDSFYSEGNDPHVEQVCWWDAVEFCARLSKYTGETYRLPSEAEWEYACRARMTTPFPFGETITTDLANYNGNYAYNDSPKGEYRKETTPVGHFGVANAFGLYDMHGNVREWCADPWHDNYEGAPSDGRVWDEENNDNRYQFYGNKELINLLADERPRVTRGGSLHSPLWCCRCTSRDFIGSENFVSMASFRVLRVPPRTFGKTIISELHSECEEDTCGKNEGVDDIEFVDRENEPNSIERIQQSIILRRGQPKFRKDLLIAYNKTCAVTGCDAEEALEAAHIIPYSETGDNEICNGLLLRADIHTLYDLNLIAIEPGSNYPNNPQDLIVCIAPKLENTTYKEFQNKPIKNIPKLTQNLPNKESLLVHYNQCFEVWYP